MITIENLWTYDFVSHQCMIMIHHTGTPDLSSLIYLTIVVLLYWTWCDLLSSLISHLSWLLLLYYYYWECCLFVGVVETQIHSHCHWAPLWILTGQPHAPSWPTSTENRGGEQCWWALLIFTFFMENGGQGPSNPHHHAIDYWWVWKWMLLVRRPHHCHDSGNCECRLSSHSNSTTQLLLGTRSLSISCHGY